MKSKNVFSVLAVALMVMTLSMPFAAEAKKSKKAKTHHSASHKKSGKHAKKGKKKKSAEASAPSTAPAGGDNVGVVEPPAL